jgi:aryl-alcohol dehydrogenase-like predicted oxidoreductase
LTGKYNEGIPKGTRASLENMAWLKDHITQERIEKVRQLEKVAGELDATTAQLAIAWLLRRKEISSVITGATKLSQLKENIAAGEVVDKLSNGVLERIEEILDNDPADE